jgi:hypothetical protein
MQYDDTYLDDYFLNTSLNYKPTTRPLGAITEEVELHKACVLITPAVVIINIPVKSLTFTVYPNNNIFPVVLEKAQNLLLNPAISDEEIEVLANLVNMKKQFNNVWSKGDLKIVGDSLTYKGEQVDEKLEHFILQEFKKNVDFDTFMNRWSLFIENISSSSFKVANRLFSFLQHNDLTISDDGCIYAWKVVRENFYDIHSNTVDYTPGLTVEMPRSKVDDNDSSYCSYGLHVCSWGYLKSFAGTGNPVLLVKIEVKDIISIPLDYDGQKIRVCKLQSVRQVGTWGVDVDSKTIPKI